MPDVLCLIILLSRLPPMRLCDVLRLCPSSGTPPNLIPISFRGSARALHLNSTHLEDTSELDGGFTGTFLLFDQITILLSGSIVSAHHFGL